MNDQQAHKLPAIGLQSLMQMDTQNQGNQGNRFVQDIQGKQLQSLALLQLQLQFWVKIYCLFPLPILDM